LSGIGNERAGRAIIHDGLREPGNLELSSGTTKTTGDRLLRDVRAIPVATIESLFRLKARAGRCGREAPVTEVPSEPTLLD